MIVSRSFWKLLVTLKPAFEKSKLSVCASVFVEPTTPTRLGILDKTKPIISQVRIPKLGVRGDISQRCCNRANCKAVSLDKIEKLKKAPINQAVRNVVKASSGMILHDVQVPLNTTNGQVLRGSWW